MSKPQHYTKINLSIPKRRDPKSMTITELDDYIIRNKPKNIYDSNKSNTSSINNSFNHIHKTLNRTSEIRKEYDSKSFISNNNSPFFRESNISYDPISDIEDRSKSKIMTVNKSMLNISSKASNNYLKALQEKIKKLTAENEEVKRNFIEVSELLENVSFCKLGTR
jgi:hypothetical protein